MLDKRGREGEKKLRTSFPRWGYNGERSEGFPWGGGGVGGVGGWGVGLGGGGGGWGLGGGGGGGGMMRRIIDKEGTLKKHTGSSYRGSFTLQPKGSQLVDRKTTYSQES